MVSQPEMSNWRDLMENAPQDISGDRARPSMAELLHETLAAAGLDGYLSMPNVEDHPTSLWEDR